MSYQVKRVDCSIAGERLEVIAPGQTFAHVFVAALPAGVAARLHWGASGEGLPIVGVGMAIDYCPAEAGGLYVTIPAGGAGVLELYVTPPGGARVGAA